MSGRSGLCTCAHAGLRGSPSPPSVPLLVSVRTPMAAAPLPGVDLGPTWSAASSTADPSRTHRAAPLLSRCLGLRHLGPTTLLGSLTPYFISTPSPSFLLHTSPCSQLFCGPSGPQNEGQGLSPPSSSSSLQDTRYLPPHPWKTVSTLVLCQRLPTLFSLSFSGMSAFASFSLKIFATSSIRPSLMPRGTCPQPPLSSFSIFQGRLRHSSHFALCPVSVVPPPLHQRAGFLCQPPRPPAQQAALGWVHREDLWRCSWASWRVASPPPEAPADQWGRAWTAPGCPLSFP